jgi:serine kinase of HPr protein (carbohydrate metabolism regulator)
VSEVLANVSCVALDGRGVLIMGAPGSGKSSLALALIDRGAMLVGDDGVVLSVADGRLHAAPPPHIAGLIELRNVGLLRLPTASAPLALALRLSPDAPRLPDAPEKLTLLGCTLPLLELWPECTALPLRAHWALTMHGLA